MTAATRWVGVVCLEIAHEEAVAERTHTYQVTVVSSSGSRWALPSATFPHPPDPHGFDRVAADIAAAIVLGGMQLPETVGSEPAYRDLLRAGPDLAHHSRPTFWPVRRADHATPVLIQVLPSHARQRVVDLPMSVRVIRSLSFRIFPETDDDGTCVLAALAQLTEGGVDARLDQPWQGTLIGSDTAQLHDALCSALSSAGFSGTTQIGDQNLEFRDGAFRAARWQALTTQIEIRIAPATPNDAALLVRILADLARRSDIADLDASSEDGTFSVLANASDPEVVLLAVHTALCESGFRGTAHLGACGRWHYEADAPRRIDMGVALESGDA